MSSAAERGRRLPSVYDAFYPSRVEPSRVGSACHSAGRPGIRAKRIAVPGGAVRPTAARDFCYRLFCFGISSAGPAGPDAFASPIRGWTGHRPTRGRPGRSPACGPQARPGLGPRPRRAALCGGLAQGAQGLPIPADAPPHALGLPSRGLAERPALGRGVVAQFRSQFLRKMPAIAGKRRDETGRRPASLPAHSPAGLNKL